LVFGIWPSKINPPGVEALYARRLEKSNWRERLVETPVRSLLEAPCADELVEVATDAPGAHFNCQNAVTYSDDDRTRQKT
jgi:hypothetical protein